MNKPTLLIMAAGMGSRYGGLKQIDKVTDKGEIIIDFSLYDAMRAGFKRAVFIIKEDMEEEFKQLIQNGAGKHLETIFVHQDLDNLPEGYTIPKGREKPWGTAHAILSAKDVIDGPFAVINADDYYGPGAFSSIFERLEKCDDEEMNFWMISYILEKTITESGHVSRGIIEVDDERNLKKITERTRIQRVSENGDIAYTEDEGKSWIPLNKKTEVSMNFWGYTSQMMKELEKRFPAFLDKAFTENPLKGEYLIPAVTDDLIQEGLAKVEVLTSDDSWYGVTYKEDKEKVVAALQSFKDKGYYPEKLWK